MLRIAICDDNLQARGHLESLITEYALEHALFIHCETFSSGLAFLQRMESGVSFDACCLDILMPEFSGMDVAMKLREQNKDMPILFCTSSPEFALQSYQVRATNYLLKPVEQTQLIPALDEIINDIKLQDSRYILVKQHGMIQKVAIRDLLYVEVLGHNITYHMANHVITCRGTFSEVVEQLLPFGNFALPHRSYCINLNHVTTVSPTEIFLTNYTVLKFSQKKISTFKQEFLQYMMKQEDRRTP